MKNKVSVYVFIILFIYNIIWFDRNVYVYLDVYVMFKLIVKLLNKICFKDELFCYYMNYFIYMYLYYICIYIFL